VLDDPSIDTSSRTGKLVMGILALIAEFENDIRRERQQDGINKAKAAGIRFGPKPILTLPVIEKVKALWADGATVPEIMRRTKLSKGQCLSGTWGCNPSCSGLARFVVSHCRSLRTRALVEISDARLLARKRLMGPI
jgi:Resolvase, N terminal domain